MAKYKYKRKEVDAEQFDDTKPMAQWPARVQLNAASLTGYSYGTLDITIDDDSQGEIMDGFEINSTDYLVTENGATYRRSESDFLSHFE